MKRAASILMALMAGALLGGAAVGSRVAAAATPTPQFAGAPCTVRVPDRQEANIRCGWVTVPEDRTASGGGTVMLAVAVLRATGPHPVPDPILYLSGGPGGPSLRGEMQNFGVEFAAPWQTDRDLVFYDQRGTGISEPGLYCDQPADPRDITLQPPGVLRLPSKAPAQILACRDRLLAQGIRLSAYNSAESARDIQDVMTALGYERWNLLGVSYGTRLALTAMRDTPSHIRSVVLDSTVPLQVEESAETARNFERSLDTLLGGCQADAGCRNAYPDLEREYFDLIARANAKPIVVTITGSDGKPVQLPITGDLILQGTFTALYSTRLIPLLPFAGDRIAHGDVGLLTVLAQQISGAFPGFAQGMTLSVQCSEEWPFLTLSAVTAGISGVRPQILAAGIGINNAAVLEEQQAICDAWSTKQPKAIENEPVRSNIPTLVLAG